MEELSDDTSILLLVDEGTVDRERRLRFDKSGDGGRVERVDRRRGADMMQDARYEARSGY